MRRKAIVGVTLIEVSLAISVIGVALCMFLPAFIQHLQFSKFEDAGHNLNALTRAIQSYYGSTHEVRGAQRTRCLPPSAGPTPAVVGVDPVEHDFAADERGGATWAALGFQPARPGRFAYSVSVSHARCSVTAAPGTVIARAEARADLDGDGQYSLFRRELVVGEDGQLHDGPLLRVRDRTE
ncbi:MAG: type II secretion system protein [Sandaracinaceae bacterium]|nr:type II secretion system protein [Sandaracinaceae bacterium]